MGAPLEGTHWLNLEDWVPSPERGLDGRFVTGHPCQGSTWKSGWVTSKESPKTRRAQAITGAGVFP